MKKEPAQPKEEKNKKTLLAQNQDQRTLRWVNRLKKKQRISHHGALKRLNEEEEKPWESK